jgi:penicillin amidase
VGEEWAHGGTVPGLLGFLAGRNRWLAWGATYSYADTSDFFVERCKGGHYWREDEWRPFRARTERVLRKRHPAAEVVVHENEHGLLEGDPTQTGDYLCWSWCGTGRGGVGSLKALSELMHCRSVSAAQQVVHGAEIPTLHMVFADAEGNIGYQFIGCVPRRREGWSGLAPVPGWQAANDWQGWLDPARELPSLLNPEAGLIVTANEARQHPQGPVLANAAQPRYRRDRIEALLGDRTGLTLADMQAIQYDLLSLQAERLRPVFLPYLPPGPQRNLLESWDARYTPDSRAATLFDHLYRAAVVEVFGTVLGRGWVEHLLSDTPLPVLLFGFLDDILCKEDSSWLCGEDRDEVLARAVHQALARPIVPWGIRNGIVFQNIFFGGRLPRLLGFDIGPHALKGCPATPHQGSKHKHGRSVTTFAPAYHFVTDLGEAISWTNLPGGPSESRLSRRYATDLRRWLAGKYKKLG